VTRRARAVRAWWIADWTWRQAWHRYSVEGEAHLLEPGSALVVGYHGRPSAHDLCMLQIYLLEKHDIVTHAFMHQGVSKVPVLRHLIEAMQFLTGDDERTAAAVAAGHKLIVTPGGTREGYRSSRVKNRVDWGERNGFIKLAMRHRLPILPAAGIGVDDTFYAPIDGYRLQKEHGLSPETPSWVGVGPFGLWPFSPPFPVKITTRIGEPIRRHLDLDPGDKAGIASVGGMVRGAVQAMLDEGRR
jgi:1-acyl-sn-glycerol-3-phosphate acyltransferase